MRWDASRPVPWRRLAKEWLIYAGIMTGVFLLVFRDQGVLPLIGGLLASGPLYLAFGWVLAKLGYQRKTLAELRTPRASSNRAAAAATTSVDMPAARARPAPTRRTSTGPQRPSTKKRR
ncbi:MAG: hypothetical protein H0U21_04345 [Acidimicrobiia bacterium]|nr:hypothetical protein [Acidimicrobiia bacterium]